MSETFSIYQKDKSQPGPRGGSLTFQVKTPMQHIKQSDVPVSNLAHKE